MACLNRTLLFVFEIVEVFGDGIGLAVTQQGNGNQLIQHENGAFTKHYQVTQSGGMHLVITNFSH